MRQYGKGRWLAVCVLLALLSACHRSPPEQQVRAAIQQAVEAARSRDAGALDDLLTPDFVMPDSRFDRRRLLGLLRVARLRNEKVSVLLGPVDVEMRGERIVATFTVTLGGGGRLIPERLGVYRVESAWREEGGDWLCYSARWKRTL
ncbi:nuclear transport factor 2 family protein [Oleiagrimonas citrea]|uniref:Nuclear transport factor 2 family protein n=1 Tax=Oleiagrimonas citrea TaxID=1665687 RepID=A0A846ZLL7_9GAMM|nr:nuclear transport factor 2 family protein [Oleiagrimonas citrea]